MKKMMLFIVPLPPPHTGMSIASELIYNSMKRDVCIRLINFNKSNFKQGVNSNLIRIVEIIRMILSVYVNRKKVKGVYFTITQSVTGNIRDLIIIWLLRKLDITIHLHGGGIHTTVFKKSMLLRMLNKRMLRYVNNVIVLGESLKSCYNKMGINDKIHVIPNSADDTLFLSKEKIVKKYSRDSLQVLFLSNLIYGKGYLELVAAVKLLPKNIKKGLRVTFVGGFECENDKHMFLNLIKNETTIVYSGVKTGSERMALYESAQLFCLPSYYPYEGQPISILEAYASGCCVVTTPHRGIVDIFKENKNGFYVEKKSVKSLVNMLIAISEMPKNELLKIGLNNNKEALQKYTNKKYVEALRALILS